MNMETNKIEYAISIGRISTTKQGLMGDSFDDQETRNEVARQRVELQYGCKIVIKEQFDLTGSASKDTLDLQPLIKVLDYCKNPKNKIKFAFFKSIDRATRAGAVIYASLKSEFVRAGVILVDTYGVIGTQSINTLEHLGVKYNWSEYSPTFINELLEAERGKSEVRDILTRMIGAEVTYVQKGYRVRPSPFGYQNTRVETPHSGKRIILTPETTESLWIIRMFELRIQGNLTDPEIVEEINKLGYKSRRTQKHDKNDNRRIVGYRGEKKLTVKQFQSYIKKPIYAGINTESWTLGNPIKCNFEGLISIADFNRANRGKITIIEEDNKIKVIEGKPSLWRLTKLKNNPQYPYKRQVLCSTCRKSLLGSASRGKSGRYFPAYHCGRGHYFRVSLTKFEETIKSFVQKVEFSEGFINRFREIILEEWEKRERQLSQDTISVSQRIVEIEQEIQILKDKVKMLTSPTTIQMIEADIEKLVLEKISLTATRENKEDQQIETQTVINYFNYFMEHLDDLLLGSPNPVQNATLFGLVFDTTPTFDELVNGTPSLACIFKLNEEYNKTKSLSVTPRGFEPRFAG